MKKFIAVLMFLLMCFSIVACAEKKPDITADYNTVQEAVQAHKDGKDIIGKTIKVELKEDKYAGVIFAEPDLNLRANLHLTLIADKSKSYEIEKIPKGKTVVAKVEMIDDHLVNSIYLFSTEYQIY